MHRKRRILAVLIALALWFVIPVLSRAQAIAPGEITPENTVILANATDARFSRDFSILLKHLRVEWVVLDRGVVPESVRGQNVIILGHPDAAHTGEIIRDVLTAAEVETLRSTTDRPVVIERENPWAEGRTVIICSGADPLLTRNGAEEAVRALIEGELSGWIQTAFDADLDQTAYDAVARPRYTWDDEELPLADLTIDLDARPPRRISAQEAAEDVEHLFTLLSHGYAGYAYFNHRGAFGKRVLPLSIVDNSAADTPDQLDNKAKLGYPARLSNHNRETVRNPNASLSHYPADFVVSVRTGNMVETTAKGRRDAC